MDAWARTLVGTVAGALALGATLVGAAPPAAALRVFPAAAPVRGCLIITVAQASAILGKPAVKIHETNTSTPTKLVVLNRGCTYKGGAVSFGYTVQTYKTLAMAKLLYSSAATATGKAPALVVKKNVAIGDGAFLRVYKFTGAALPYMDQIEVRKGSVLFVTNIGLATNDGGAKAITAAKDALPRM